MGTFLLLTEATRSRVDGHLGPQEMISLDLDGFLVRAIVNYGLAGVDVDWAAGFGFNSHNTLMIFHSPLNLATER